MKNLHSTGSMPGAPTPHRRTITSGTLGRDTPKHRIRRRKAKEYRSPEGRNKRLIRRREERQPIRVRNVQRISGRDERQTISEPQEPRILVRRQLRRILERDELRRVQRRPRSIFVLRERRLRRIRTFQELRRNCARQGLRSRRVASRIPNRIPVHIKHFFEMNDRYLAEEIC